jgi:hypothetical protein
MALLYNRACLDVLCCCTQIACCAVLCNALVPPRPPPQQVVVVERTVSRLDGAVEGEVAGTGSEAGRAALPLLGMERL